MAKKFTIGFPNGAVAAYEGDFEISKDGILIVTPTSGGSADTSQLIFSPAGWWVLDVKEV
jgi:hypothetical protein